MNSWIRANALPNLFLCILMLGFSLPAVSSADDDNTVYWPYFSFPPLFIIEKDAPPTGYCIEIQSLLIEHLPEYRHKIIPAPISRMLLEVEKGRHLIPVGPIKGPGREKTMTFSIPMRIGFLTHLIIRSEDHETLGSGSDLSLREMMRNPTLKLGRLDEGAYGAVNDAIFGEFPDHDRTAYVTGENPLPQLIAMLDLGRVDFILWDPVAFGYTVKKLGYEGRFKVLPVREQKASMTAGYVVWPKNEWGQRIGTRINHILEQAILSGRMFEIQSKYIPPFLMDDFTKAYEDLIVSPLKKADGTL